MSVSKRTASLYFEACIGRVIRFIVFTLGVSFLAYLWGRSSVDCTIPLESRSSLPSQLLRQKHCQPPTPIDIEQANLAAEVLGKADADYSLLFGAEKFLANGPFHIGRSFRPGDLNGICLPHDIFARVARSESVIQGFVPSGNLDEIQLRLAAWFSEPDPKVITSVAASAWLAPAKPTRMPRVDLRPVARTVLAGFGRTAAAPYAERAFREMSGDDSLGTGAAQIAAAAGYPGALSRIEFMMTELLRTTPADAPVPYIAKHHFYELAYALYYAGSDGLAHLAPVRQIMKRSVITLAVEFGHIPTQPRQMCALLDLMEGKDKSEAHQYDYCRDTQPYDFP